MIGYVLLKAQFSHNKCNSQSVGYEVEMNNMGLSVASQTLGTLFLERSRFSTHVSICSILYKSYSSATLDYRYIP
jgi:hypothetical protein